MPAFSIGEWRAAQIRLTTFLAAPLTASTTEWFQAVAGAAPFSRSEDVRAGTREEIGDFGDNAEIAIRLSVERDRIDWLVLPRVGESVAPTAPPTIGAFPEALARFGEVARRWLSFEAAPPISRVALGGILIHEVANHIAGYEELASFLMDSVRLSGSNSSDFVYQINRPRISATIPELRINRLCKWNVMEWRVLRVPIVTEASATRCTRLELDINSDPSANLGDRRSLLPPLFDEMARMATEIAERGDIA